MSIQTCKSELWRRHSLVDVDGLFDPSHVSSVRLLVAARLGVPAHVLVPARLSVAAHLVVPARLSVAARLLVPARAVHIQLYHRPGTWDPTCPPLPASWYSKRVLWWRPLGRGA